MDDGSTDGTRAILRGFADADPRVRLIEKANEGLIATLNRGIAEARAGLIARIDHDDLMRPARLERQAEFLDRNADFIGVGCLLQNIDAHGAPIGTPPIRHETLRHAPQSFPPRQQWLYGPTPMIRADALRKVGGYREKFVAAEDRDLCWRLGAIGRLARLPEVLVEHRQHGANMSIRHRRTQLFSALMGDLSAIAAHFQCDDSPIVKSIVVSGDYRPPLDAYRRLLAPHYPIDTYILFYQMRWELWDVPGFPTRAGIVGALMRHLAAKPWQAARLKLVRRAGTYLMRKPRAPASETPSG